MSRYLRVRHRWFAYNPMRINVGSIGWAERQDETGVISPDYVVFSCSDRIEPKFAFLFLRSAVGLRAINLQTAVSVRERLYFNSLARISIALPPLTEQQRVVTHIEELTSQIEEARTLRQEAANAREGILRAKELQIWPKATLEDAVSLESLTTFLARGKQAEQGDSDHFLIKTQHVQQDRYVPTLLRLSPNAAAKVRPEAIAHDGDILIACSAAGCLGRVARYRDDGSRVASTDTHVAIARPNRDLVELDYLYAYLRGAQGQHQLRSRERGDWQRAKISFRLTELNLSDLRKVPVPLPSKREQRRIVRELSALETEVEALRLVQSETTTELDALLPTILDRAFKGKL